MKGVLLAAGLGTRLGALTNNTPKCLVPLGEKTILEHQVSILRQCEIDEIWLVIGTKGDCWTQENYERIKSTGLNLVYNFENIFTQNTYSLHLALKNIDKGPLLAIDGDLVFDTRTIEEVLKTKHDAFIVSRQAQDRSEVGSKVVMDGNGRLTEIGKTITPKTFPWGIHSGLIKIGEENFSTFQELSGKDEFYARDTGVLLNSICKISPVYSLTVKGFWVNVNTPEDYQSAMSIA